MNLRDYSGKFETIIINTLCINVYLWDNNITNIINDYIYKDCIKTKDGWKRKMLTRRYDRVHGIFQKYSKNGNIIESTMFVNGLKNGMHETYNGEGKILSRCNYTNNKKNGIEEIYENKRTFGLIVTNYYKNGVLHGESREYINQKLFKVSNYVDGIEHGIQDLYYDTYHIKKQIMNGKSTSASYYNTHGKLFKMIECTNNGEIAHLYNDDKTVTIVNLDRFWNKTGVAKTYDDFKHLLKEDNYTCDKKNGVCTQWRKDGSLFCVVSYKNDKKDGPCSIYHANGQVAIMSNWKNDHVYGHYQEWNEDGLLLKDVVIDDDDELCDVIFS